MKKTYTFLNIIVLGLAACNPTENQPTDIVPIPTQMRDEKCIHPVTDFEFPVREGRTSSETLSVPLPSTWKPQAKLDEGSQTTLELIENRAGTDSIWLRSDDRFFLYQTDTQQWESIPFGQNGDDPVDLFQTQSGEVWALQQTAPETRPLFLRLGADRKFEFVQDVNGELTTDWSISRLPGITIDDNGMVWLVVDQDDRDETALFSFDPQTQKSKKHLTGKRLEYGTSIALSRDGSIFLLRTDAMEIVQYDPVAETSRTIGLKEVAEGDFHDQGSADLFFDEAGNLWLNDYGWLDFSSNDYPRWHQIVRSPLFIKKNINAFYTYFWDRPVPTVETADGRILFRRGGGLTWLDPAKGEWCKFTTVDSEVLSDSNGDLWLFDNNTLYKYDPSEESAQVKIWGLL